MEMKTYFVIFAMLFNTLLLSAADYEIAPKKIGETSASFIVKSDDSRTILLLYPSTEMAPNVDFSKANDISKESVDLSNLKAVKNNAYVVFDGTSTIIPITIKSLKANSGYFLTMMKPSVKNFKPITYEFSTVAPEPKAQAKGIAFKQPTENTISLIWTKGDGAARIVVASKSVAKIDPPQEGLEYKSSSKFGESKIGIHSFVVYSGTGTECKVENLEAGTTYNFQVFEFNGKGKSTNYSLVTNSGNPRAKSTAIPPPVMLAAKDVSEIGFVAKWKGTGTIEKYILDIAYDEKFTNCAPTYKDSDVGDIEEIEVTDLDPQKDWYIRVKAVSEGAQSQYSKVMKVK